jgi:hypothetical protein
MKNYGGTNVLPLFQNFEQMQHEEREALQEYATDNEKIFAKYDAVMAIVADDEPALAKFADSDVELAKSYVRQHGARATSEATFEAGAALLAALKRRNARLYGVGELAKRTQRFAMAVSRRYDGPTSAVVAMEKKSND